MFERIRFARYALKFERAFKTDRWDEVKACFHPDATYNVIGSATEWDGEVRGADAIVAFFKRMLDQLDRKFDSRQPRPGGWWRVTGGELVVPWKAKYTIGDRSMWLSGVSRCRFEGGLIRALSDEMNADECVRWGEMIGVTAQRSG